MSAWFCIHKVSRSELTFSFARPEYLNEWMFVKLP